MPVPARLQRWLPKIRQYASKWGVPADLLASIIDFESGGDPTAGHKTSGATGLGQVMPREAGFPGRPTKAELLDPDTNLDWSARILSDAWKRWGTPQQASAAYLGALDAKGNVTNAADANGTTGHAYVAKIMGNLQAFGADVGRDGASAPAAGTAGTDAAPARPAYDLRAFLDTLAPPTDAERTSAPVRSRPPVAGATAASAGGRMWPVAGQRPGAVLNPFGGKQFRSSGAEGLSLPSSNTGADLVARYGDGVVAEDDGQVVEVYQARQDTRHGGRNAKENFGYGGSVIVRYRDGSKARYSHLAAGTATVQPGQTVRRGQLLGQAGDSGNATGPHVDYMYWNPQGQLTDGAAQPGFVGGQVTVGAQGRPLAPGAEGQAGRAPAGAPTISQASWRQFLDTLAPPQGATPASQPMVAGMSFASDRSFLDSLPPPSPEDYRGQPGTRDASFKYGRDEPQPTPWDYRGQPGLRDASFVYGRDEGATIQQLSDTGTGARAMADGPAYPDAQSAYPPEQGAYPPSQSAYPPAPGDTPGIAAGAAGASPGTPGSTTRPMGTPGTVTAPGGAPGGTPPGGGPDHATPPAGQEDVPEDVARRRDAERIRAENAARYGIRDPNPPVEGSPAADPSLSPLRRDRERENQNLIDLGVRLAEAKRKASLPPPDPASDPKGDAKAAWDLAKKDADAEAASLGQQYNTQFTRVRQFDTDIEQAVQRLTTKANAPGGGNNPVTKEVIGPDGKKVTVQWMPDPKNPKGGTWELLPGFGQGAEPRERKVTAHDAGGYIALWDEEGNLVGTAPKTLGPDQMEPQVIGSATGPEMLVYDPAKGTVTKMTNPGYERKPTQVTAGQDSPYIVRQDPVTGQMTAERNPNFNPWGAGNRIEGKGAAEGKVMYVTPDGQVKTLDMMSPEERADIASGAKAEVTKTVAEADKLKVEADIKKKEQEAWDEIQAAIDAGATPGQVRGLVERAVRSVQDYATLRNAETSRQTQIETARHNLAGEQEGMRTRRTAEAGEARQGAESYGRYGMASAPFQTALLGSLSQVADPRQVAGTMNIGENVFGPVAQQYDTHQQDLKATQARQDELVKRAGEPLTEPYTRPGATTTTTTQPAPPGPQGQPTSRTPGQTYTGKPVADASRQAVDLKDQGKPGWARTYYDDNTYEDWQIPPTGQPGAGGSPADTVAPAGAPGGLQSTAPGALPGETDEQRRQRFYSQPAQASGAGLGGGQQGPTPPLQTSEHAGQSAPRRRRTPMEGKRAVWAGDGWVKTHYDDGSVETWHVDDGPSWEGVGGGGAGNWGEDPPTMYLGWDKGTVGGGGSLWTMAPPPSVDVGYGAQTAMAQAEQNPPRRSEQPAGTAGGFAGPAAQTNSAGGGGEYGAPPAASGSGVFGTNAPSALSGQRQAPMWDAATPAPFATSGVGGPSGNAGQTTLYAPGASAQPAPVGGGALPVNRATAPPRTNGSYYGGPGLPQAMSPLQRLLQQTGVIPLSAGRAAGAPGTV